MSLIQHNIEKEERLIELLGYSLVGPSASNTWLIIDKNQNQVGFIKYKKLYNGNKKKGYTKIFGYHTLLEDQPVTVGTADNTNVDIVNTTGTELPSTGGAGLYIVAGVAIVALLGFGGTAMLKRKVNGED